MLGFDEHSVSLALSGGGRAAGNIFGVHRDEVEYDDGAHGESAESVGEGVEGVMCNHGDNNLLWYFGGRWWDRET